MGLERRRERLVQTLSTLDRPHVAMGDGGCLLPSLYRHLPLKPFLLLCEVGVTGWAQGCSRRRGSRVYEGVGPWAVSL